MTVYQICRPGPSGVEILAEWHPVERETLTLHRPTFLREQLMIEQIANSVKRLRPDWGHGPNPPVLMFTEAEIVTVTKRHSPLYSSDYNQILCGWCSFRPTPSETYTPATELTPDHLIEMLKKERHEHAPPLG